MTGFNNLVGPSGLEYQDATGTDQTVVITDPGHATIIGGQQADGSQIGVAAFVFGALVFLVLMRMGGFQTVIAASVTRG